MGIWVMGMGMHTIYSSIALQHISNAKLHIVHTSVSKCIKYMYIISLKKGLKTTFKGQANFCYCYLNIVVKKIILEAFLKAFHTLR